MSAGSPPSVRVNFGSIVSLLVLVVILLITADGITSLGGDVLSFLGSVLPAYGRRLKVQIALGITQVAVLFFAGLVAILQFVARADTFNIEQNRLLTVTAAVSVVATLVAGILAVLHLASAGDAWLSVALFSLAAGFLFSVSVATIMFSNIVSAENDRVGEQSASRGDSETINPVPVRRFPDGRLKCDSESPSEE